MLEVKDYYRILGVDETAGAEEIRSAFRRLAMACHPDRMPGDQRAEERFRAASEAYEVLIDPIRRHDYDLRRLDLNGNSTAAGPYDEFGGFGLQDAFASLSAEAELLASYAADNGIMTLSDAMPPRHMEVQVRLSFREALEGGSRDILLPDGRPTTVRWAQGLRPGTTVLRRGQGYRPNGDLLIAFQVDPSPRFRRQGDNLIVTETISVLEAMVGTTRTVQNAYGKSIRVTVRPGVQHGERLRIAGQGVRLAKGSPGDLYVEINLTVPKTLTEEQRAELEACARRLGII